MDKIIELDKKLFLFLNGFHTDELDSVMLLITKTNFWTPLYLLLIYFIFKRYNSEGWLILAGAAIMIILSDQITSSLMKPFFARLRPSHDPSLQGLVHLVDDYRGGLYGFASSHAANTFATALFVWLLFRDSVKWSWVIFIWAVLIAYTRIYLGVHFPGDILGGAMVGLGCGYVGFQFCKWLAKKFKLQGSRFNSMVSN